MTTSLYPLRFQPLLHHAIWGGRRLATSLGKSLGPGSDWAESWELCDHGDDQSVVAFGPLVGATLRQLVAGHNEALFGRHAPQKNFPLLLKFLDGSRTLSVQVHPNDAQAAKLDPPDAGKTEAWYVVEALPDSVVYAGLQAGVAQADLEAAIRSGACEECLHSFAAAEGDCVFVPAGTVHALGAGLLVAEIQQSSDTTYRLFDWNRPGPDGRPRKLHIEQGLAATDFARGPVSPVQPQATDRPHVKRLVDCEKFIWDRWTFAAPEMIGGDSRFHILTVLEGGVRIDGDPSETVLPRGGSALLPASIGAARLTPQEPTVLLDAYLPN